MVESLKGLGGKRTSQILQLHLGALAFEDH